MRLQPAPLTTKITNDDSLTQPWSLWLRNLSSNLVESCIVTSAQSYHYGLNGNILTIVYSGNGSESINLPYGVAIDTVLPYYKQSESGEWSIGLIPLSKDQYSVSIPAGIIKINACILISPKNR
jgi:hypothetical protein